MHPPCAGGQEPRRICRFIAGARQDIRSKEDRCMHFKSISLSLAFAGLLLAGCSSTDKTETPAAAAPTAEASSSAAAPSFSGSCDSSGLDSLVGKNADTALVEQAQRKSGAETARVLRPHQQVNMEYNSRRLNIDGDEAGVVKQFSCG